MNAQGLSKNHPTEGFRHPTKHNLMFSHQTGIQHFFNHIIPSSLSLKNLRANIINKCICDGFWVFGFLDVWIRVGIETFLVLYLFRELVLSNQIEGQQVDYCLLPCDRTMRVDQTYTVFAIVLYLAHCASMWHESLSCDICWWVDLQKDQIPIALG